MAIPTAPVRLTLPEARPRYDADNEQETRRLIELAFQRLPEPSVGIESADSIIRFPFVLLWNADATVSDLPAAATEIDATNKRLRRVADLVGMRAARIVGNISSGAPGASFRVQFSIDEGASWNDLGCELPAGTPGQPVVGDYKEIPLAAATHTTWLRPVTVGGNGVVDVTFSWLEVQFAPALPDPIPIEEISGLKFWFESDFGVFADQAGTIPQTTDGGGILHWHNKVEGGANFTSGGGGAEPLLDKTNLLNGLPVIRFEGFRAFQLPTGSVNGWTAGEIFVVVKTDADPQTVQSRTGFYFFSPTGPNVVHYPWIDGKVLCNFGSTTRYDCGNPSFPLTQWHIHGCYSAANDWAIMINGAPFFTSSNNTVNFPNSVPFLGYSGGSYYLHGRVAAVLLFSKKLSGAERASVLNYLGNKYAL